MIDLELHKQKVQKKSKEHNNLFKRLKKIKTKELDQKINQAHDKVFENMNCLNCANCCKTTSPIFSDKDIQRISKFLRIKPSELTHKYLKIDKDNDFVLKSSPCLFLQDDNKCSIYDVRPKACKGYPHTDRVKQSSILNLTKKNVEVCPAVFNIVEKLNSSF